MRINITAGECLNDILERKYPNEKFVPFNEAMIQGTFSSSLFSDDFIRERSETLQVSEEEYKEKLSQFMKLLKHIEEYQEIFLWFGDEPFCVENRRFVLNALKEYGYSGNIFLNIVTEQTGDIIKQNKIK